MLFSHVTLCCYVILVGIYVHCPASCSSCQPAIQQRLGRKQSLAEYPSAAVYNAAAAPKQRHFAPQTQLQQGVLRTNCIDCLDRTNVVQFAYGLAAFGRQLSALGILDEQGVDSDSSIAFQLMEMYEGMGHTLALQVMHAQGCIAAVMHGTVM